MPLGSLRGAFFSAVCGATAAESITRRICKPLQIRCATLVGYLNKTNCDPGVWTLATPCFSNVGSTGKVTLKDIVVTGYRNADGSYCEWCEDGVEAACLIAKINGSGATLMVDGKNVIYYWWDTPKKPAGWYDTAGKPMTKDGGSLWGDAADIEFTNGNGFRIMMSEEYVNEDTSEPYKFQLAFNGEVIRGDAEIAYEPGLWMAAGNPTPVEINLAQITVGGYTDEQGEYIEWCADGVENACLIAKINGSGATLMVDGKNVIYYWWDTKKKAAGWYDTAGKPMTKDGGSLWGDAADIKYGAGDGFRVMMSEEYVDDEDNPIQFTLKIPSCLD